MSYKKGEIVQASLDAIGISDYEFDVTPGELESGVRKLDAMMGYLSDKGVILSYPISDKYDGSASDEESNIPDVAIEAVITNLALRLAPSYGKQVPMELRSTAKTSLNQLYAVSAAPRKRPIPSIPKGAGYKSMDSPFTPVPQDTALEDVDDTVELSGGQDGA
jgi:hypothetical protein